MFFLFYDQMCIHSFLLLEYTLLFFLCNGFLYNLLLSVYQSLKLVQLAQKDATPLANIDKKFKIVVHFGDMLAMTVDMKLISFNSEASLGDLPIVSISFAK